MVSLVCRADLARVRDLPDCSDIDLHHQRSPCSLSQPADTAALTKVAAVSGDVGVRNALTNVCFPHDYHCVIAVRLSSICIDTSLPCPHFFAHAINTLRPKRNGHQFADIS